MSDDAVIGAEPVEESISDFIGEQFDAAEASGIESEPSVEETRDRAEEPAPQDEAVEVSAETDDVSAESEVQIASAPQSMSSKDREAFYALPPDSQQWLSDRAKEQEADYTKKTMEVAEQRKYYEGIEQVIAPRRQQFAMNGMDVSTGLNQIFTLSDFAGRDPVGFSRLLLKNSGIPLSALTETDTAGAEPGNPQIAEMQQRLSGFENHFAQQNQQQLVQQGQVVSGVIEEFANQHPFYSELEDDMVPIIVALKDSKPGLTHNQYLDMAYKMVVAANDNVSSKIEIDRKAQADADRVAKAKKNAASARRAGGTNIQSTGSLPSGVAHSKNVDEFIGDLYEQLASA